VKAGNIEQSNLESEVEKAVSGIKHFSYRPEY
jgi:hypothetical protein